MEKLEIKSGYNQVSVNSNLSGTGTTESPIGYTGDFQHTDKRSLLWESTGNDYNTNITLSEPVTHFDQIMVYGSGLEAADTMHVSKNVYRTQDKLMGCDAWCYSPWTTAFQANYILAANLKISGNSGHIGGSMYWGIGSKNATWAAGKWTGTEAPKMLMPWKIFGLGRHPIYNFYGLDSDGGSVVSNIPSGYSGDTATLTVTPSGDEWKCSAINITGAELTGNDFMFGNSNVTAQAEFEHSKELTLENGDHGVLSADKMSGFSGDVVTVDATTDEGWYFTGLNITGATATGNQFMFVGNDVTAEGLYTDEGYPITYIINGSHVNVTGDQIYVPGSTGITLTQTYDEYYRPNISVDNGTIENGVLIANGPCTVTVNDGLNTFTARGNLKWTNNFNGSYQGVKQAFPALQITGWTSTYTPSSNMTGGVGTNYGATGTNTNNFTGQRGWKTFTTWQSESLRAPVNCSAWKMSGHINLTGQHNAGNGIMGESEHCILTAGIACVGTNASPGTGTTAQFFPRSDKGTNTLSKNFVATAAKYGTATNLGSYGFYAIGWNYDQVTNGSRWTYSWAYNRITNFNGTWYASGILP